MPRGRGGGKTRATPAAAPGGAAPSAAFPLLPPPLITGFSPASGPVGTSVTIDGTGFTGASAGKLDAKGAGGGEDTGNPGGRPRGRRAQRRLPASPPAVDPRVLAGLGSRGDLGHDRRHRLHGSLRREVRYHERGGGELRGRPRRRPDDD